MKKIIERLIWHDAFEVGTVIKGIDGILQLIGGTILYFISHATIDRMVIFLTEKEISHDPNDLVSNYLINLASAMSLGTKKFIALYLILHGVAKIILVFGLLRDKKWAYPGTMIFLGTFICYQIYRLMVQVSFGFAWLTIFDIIFFILVWHEYKNGNKVINQTIN